MKSIPNTDLAVFPLCLGGNVFGWTANEQESFALLDAYAEAGGNFIDTADVYSAWAPGNVGGESEAILGRWMRARGNRNRMVIATKVGKRAGLEGLAPKTIRAAVEASLTRLQTDTIDLYYAHVDDEATPLGETLHAFDALIGEGHVRYLGASNYSASRLAEALDVSKREGLARYVALQPHYNLVHRGEYEGELEALCARESVACVPYFALANGFLTGKYRPGATVDSQRADRAEQYLDARGLRVLGVLDELAAVHDTTIAAVALAWLAASSTVVAPLASARTTAQLADLLPVARVHLRDDEHARLTRVSAIAATPT